MHVKPSVIHFPLNEKIKRRGVPKKRIKIMQTHRRNEDGKRYREKENV
jgi:hypothetical protein